VNPNVYRLTQDRGISQLKHLFFLKFPPRWHKVCDEVCWFNARKFDLDVLNDQATQNESMQGSGDQPVGRFAGPDK
jgi:hypothetical protein